MATYEKLKNFLSFEWEDEFYQGEKGTIPGLHEGIDRLHWRAKAKPLESGIDYELRRPTFEEFIQAYQIKLPTYEVV